MEISKYEVHDLMGVGHQFEDFVVHCTFKGVFCGLVIYLYLPDPHTSSSAARFTVACLKTTYFYCRHH